MMNSQKFMKGYRAGQSGRYIAHILDISQLVPWRVSFIDGWRCEGRAMRGKAAGSEKKNLGYTPNSFMEGDVFCW